MATLIRFKPVEINSKICFIGKKKKILNYQVRSIALVPVPGSKEIIQSFLTVPEIFWQ